MLLKVFVVHTGNTYASTLKICPALWLSMMLHVFSHNINLWYCTALATQASSDEGNNKKQFPSQDVVIILIVSIAALLC